jgi:hypothetical protein
MGIPTSEVGYTSATTGSGYHEVHKGHVVVNTKNKNNTKCNKYRCGKWGNNIFHFEYIKTI